MPTSKDIHEEVTRVIMESLNVDEDDLLPTATLQGDLGAESIDFLDITFRLEREFDIIIPRGELFPETLFHGDADLVDNGRITDLGMHELRSRMPYADLSAIDKERRVAAVGEMFTVGLVSRYMVWKLSQPQPQNAPAALLRA